MPIEDDIAMLPESIKAYIKELREDREALQKQVGDLEAKRRLMPPTFALYPERTTRSVRKTRYMSTSSTLRCRVRTSPSAAAGKDAITDVRTLDKKTYATYERDALAATRRLEGR